VRADTYALMHIRMRVRPFPLSARENCSSQSSSPAQDDVHAGRWRGWHPYR